MASRMVGVASRMVGVAEGVINILVAFVPKVPAVVLAIPNPVVGSFLLVLLAILFLIGMKLVVQNGLVAASGKCC